MTDKLRCVNKCCHMLNHDIERFIDFAKAELWNFTKKQYVVVGRYKNRILIQRSYWEILQAPHYLSTYIRQVRICF